MWKSCYFLSFSESLLKILEGFMSLMLLKQSSSSQKRWLGFTKEQFQYCFQDIQEIQQLFGRCYYSSFAQNIFQSFNFFPKGNIIMSKSKQIPYHQFTTEYKQCSLIFRHKSYQISYARLLSTRQKLILLKISCEQNENRQILKDLQQSELLQEINGINHIAAFCLQSQRKSPLQIVYILYEFGQISLSSLLEKSSQLSRRQAVKLVDCVKNSLLKIGQQLTSVGINPQLLALPFKFVHVKQQLGGIQSFSFTIFPSVIRRRLQQQPKLNEWIYSKQDLQQINRKQRGNKIIKIKSDPMITWQKKVGLLTIKLILSFCQTTPQKSHEPNLYALNEHFHIDYNWPLIKSLLHECQSNPTYLNVAHSAKSLLFSGDMMFQESDPNEKRRDELERKLKRLPKVETLMFENGKYIGEVKEGMRHGYGVYYFNAGQVYGGEWRDDEMIGRGMYLFTAGQCYEGEIYEGLREGEGTYFYKGGIVYSGNWKNDEKNGEGRLYDSIQGLSYVGNFAHNLYHGSGRIIYQNGALFNGHFRMGKKHGQGEFKDNHQNTTFRAIWQNGEIVSKAEIYFINGDYYFGQFKDGKMQGFGIYQYKNGTKYEGNFRNNQFEGQCQISYSNSDHFNGSIKNRNLSDGNYSYFEP